MKKFDRRSLKQCSLEAVNSSTHVRLPGVPEHFNYGIFFDDGYDYMQHLKEVSQSNERLAYRIVGIPEDDVPETEELEPVEDRPREPEADARDMVVDGLGLDSDEEIDVASEIEDNFVELAGGHAVKDDNSDSADNPKEAAECSPPKVINPREVLSKDKVIMMERFLYGDNERNEEHESSSDNDSEFEQYEYPDETVMTNRQFEKLLMRLKAQTGSANQSMVTGTSMMSEGLQYALLRDTRILQNQKSKSDDLNDLESDLRAKTLASANRAMVGGSTESLDFESNEEESKEKTDIMSIQGDTNCSTVQPSFCLLSVPQNPKSRSRQISTESLHTVGQTLTTLKTSEVDPALLVRRRGETAEQKLLRKVAVKQHRQERRQIRKINQANFRAEHERQLKKQLSTLTIT